MTVAEMIKTTRTEHHMTQEEFGDKFGVTRQTVSSWENEKSIPDLEMLITICNTYQISLDALLNADHAYVKKVDVLQKLQSNLKKIFAVLICIFGIVAVLSVIRIQVMHSANETYKENVTEAGFEFENKHYIKRESGVKYELPNQKMPFWQSEFMASHIQAVYENNGQKCYINLDLDDNDSVYRFFITYATDKSLSGNVDRQGEIFFENLTEEDERYLSLSEKEVEEILKNLVYYYNVAYNVKD